MRFCLLCFIPGTVDVNTQLKAATTKCRAAKSQCDLAEYCSGTGPLCPTDVHRRNTDLCAVNGVCHHSVLTLFIKYTKGFLQSVCDWLKTGLTPYNKI